MIAVIKPDPNPLKTEIRSAIHRVTDDEVGAIAAMCETTKFPYEDLFKKLPASEDRLRREFFSTKFHLLLWELRKEWAQKKNGRPPQLAKDNIEERSARLTNIYDRALSILAFREEVSIDRVTDRYLPEQLQSEACISAHDAAKNYLASRAAPKGAQV